MGARALLGAADVDDEGLATMVARSLGEDHVELLEVDVSPVDYDLPALTTVGRYWVHGTALAPTGDRSFRVFVKHVRCWSRSPFFDAVPPAARERARAAVPWRTEPEVYRSDLSCRLPQGLSMPTVLGVHDLQDDAAAIWLAEVPASDRPWDLARYARAAHLLGRLAASPAVAPLAEVGGHDWSLWDYLEGRVRHQVVPMLEEDRLWAHPVLAGSFTPALRDRMRAAAARGAELVTELVAGPAGTGHGDACPNNLLGAPAPDDFVLIDFGFWCRLPLGFDLGQLLLGEVQLGRRPAATLAETDAAVVPEYARGLAAEGVVVDTALLWRMHALQMVLFTGISCMPFEHLGDPPSPELDSLAADRASIASYCLDLLDSTG